MQRSMKSLQAPKTGIRPVLPRLCRTRLQCHAQKLAVQDTSKIATRQPTSIITESLISPWSAAAVAAGVGVPLALGYGQESAVLGEEWR